MDFHVYKTKQIDSFNTFVYDLATGPIEFGDLAASRLYFTPPVQPTVMFCLVFAF